MVTLKNIPFIVIMTPRDELIGYAVYGIVCRNEMNDSEAFKAGYGQLRR